MSKFGQIVQLTLRLVASVQSYLYPGYVTLVRLFKLERAQTSHNVLALQVVCDYWFLQLVITAAVILFNDLLLPVFFEGYFRVALSVYLTMHDFEHSQLLYRGVVCKLFPKPFSLMDLVTPKVLQDVVQTPRVQTKKTAFPASRSIVIGEGEVASGSKFSPTIE